MSDLSNYEIIKGHFENYFKSANYLFVSHGVGLVGCITALKDYSSSPELKGLGIFIVLFGVGFLSAIFNYIALTFSRLISLDLLRKNKKPDEAARAILMWVHGCSSFASLACLVAALVILIIKFAHL